MPLSKRKNWDTVESNISPNCLSATPTPSEEDEPTFKIFPKMTPKTGCEKKGGRKPASIAQPGLLEQTRKVVENHTAGSPVDPRILWTNRSAEQIAEELQDAGFSLDSQTVRKILLEDLNLGLRRAEKNEAWGITNFVNSSLITSHNFADSMNNWAGRC